MAKEFDEIMQDMTAWQEEKEGRAVICFAVDKKKRFSTVVAGRGAEIIAAMAYHASKSKDTTELIEAALDVAKMAEATKNVVDKK